MFETADWRALPPEEGKRREQRALDALYEVGKLLAGGGDAERLLTPALRVLASFTELQYGLVALAPSEHRLTAGAAAGCRSRLAAAAEPGVPPALAEALAPVFDGVLRTGVAAVYKDVIAELGADAAPAGLAAETTAALLAVPIRAVDGSGRTSGVLAAYRLQRCGEPRMLGGDLRLLAMVAALMAQSLRAPPPTVEPAGAAAPPAPAGGQPAWPTGLVGANIVGDSPEIRGVLQRITKVAPTRAAVLLRGESGTGKELFAAAIHRLSNRRDKPMVKLNCAALSENLLESELFGHEKGAFTGAIERKKGRFELADGGTLFLDEIGEISPAFQVKLLRALQEGEFERVGGSQTIRVDVRVVTATNRDLEAAVVTGHFRADLYFRICVVPITLPPLRERRGDIPPLANAFLDRFNRENGTRLRFSQRALAHLAGCFFPGNIRELENCVSRVATLSAGPVIDVDDLSCVGDDCLSPLLQRRSEGSEEAPAPPGLAESEPGPATSPARDDAPPLEDGRRAAEGSTARSRQELIDAMEKSGWVQAKAARLLGLTPRQIAYALKKHGIDVVKF
ncbi:MAG: nif-specific transcriptional activator NifA [Alphaproteobacteria bacterium]|jgi:Nif-specific regulatory protein|nr:nif-specific transcriptional activator NifA [Alphaproteobacteria bacterium]